MCMCGGILEVGLVCAIVGYVGKKLHKCKCDCHEEIEHTCKHCSTSNKFDKNERPSIRLNPKEQKMKKSKYKIVQWILTIIIVIGMCMMGYVVIKNHFLEHNHNHTPPIEQNNP